MLIRGFYLSFSMILYGIGSLMGYKNPASLESLPGSFSYVSFLFYNHFFRVCFSFFCLKFHNIYSLWLFGFKRIGCQFRTEYFFS